MNQVCDLAGLADKVSVAGPALVINSLMVWFWLLGFSASLDVSVSAVEIWSDRALRVPVWLVLRMRSPNACPARRSLCPCR